MFTPKTVFVLGAGASCDLGLPTGDDLRLDLMNALESDPQHYRFRHGLLNIVFQELSQRDGGGGWPASFHRYATAAEKIRAGLPLAMSIDNFLDAHRHDEILQQVGKLAIAAVILEKEYGSAVGVAGEVSQRGKVQFADITNPRLIRSWYLPLMRLLVSGRTVASVNEIFDNIAFVIFNYDRCLEHFLINAIVTYFNVSDDVAIDAVNSLEIIHPYGQVGHLSWQRDASIVCSFGSSDGRLVEIAQRIRTFTESANEGVVARARQLIGGAESLVFMGFGFLPQNMELLTVENRSTVKRVFLTTNGIGDNDVSIAVSEIGNVIGREAWYKGRISLHNDDDFLSYVERGTCRELMDHNWLRLTRD